MRRMLRMTKKRGKSGERDPLKRPGGKSNNNSKGNDDMSDERLTTTETYRPTLTTTTHANTAAVTSPPRDSTSAAPSNPSGKPTSKYTNNVTVTTPSSWDGSSPFPTGSSGVSYGTSSIRTTLDSPLPVGNMAATIFPFAGAIFLLLLLVGFVLLRKKTLKDKRSKQDSVKSQSKGTKLELGDVKHTMNDYAETDKIGKESLRETANQNATDGVKYEEVDENARTTREGNTPQRGKMAPPDYDKVNAQGSSNGYEEANIRGTQGTQNKQGYKKTKYRGWQDDQGYETAKLTGPFYHTLDPNAPSDSSYVTVSGSKQDGGYDALDRQHDSSQAKSKIDSEYDVTERIGKGNAKVEPSNQIGNDYSAISRSSADTSAYDKLDHTRRSYEVDNISPNTYSVLQPQEKD